jgi:TolB-like protein
VALYETIRRRSAAKTVRPEHLRYEEPGTGSGEEPVRPASDRHAVPETEPSIALLPFRNLSTDSTRDLLAEALTEDLIEALSRVPGLFVISRLSAAALKPQGRSSRDIGAALGVRYILTGSIRIVGDRFRLIVELVHTESGKAIWVARFDESSSSLLELQNDLAERIAVSIAPHLRSAELKRIRVRRPEDQNAYELFLRAQEAMHSSSKTAFESAEQLFDAAIDREPHYAAALAWRAHWHVLRVGQGWSNDPRSDTDRAVEFASKAIESDPTEALAFAVQGHIAAYLRKDFDFAFGCFETALRLNPNSPRAWLWNANTHAYVGDGRQAVEKVQRAIALAPFDPLMYAYSCSANIAYLANQQYERAAEAGFRCIREHQGYTSGYKMLIPALVMAGRAEEARAPAHRLLSLEPGFTVARFRSRFPGSASPLGELCAEALAQAGVPLG